MNRGRWLLFGAWLALSAATAWAGTAFTYQGQLTLHGNPVNSACSMQFRLFNQSTGGSLLDTIGPQDVAVSGGVFTALLDFGADKLGSGDRWLEISVDCGTGLIQLSPRQAITATPYAIRALSADNPAVRIFEFAVTSSSWDNGAGGGGNTIYSYVLPASLTGGKSLREWLAGGSVILGYAKPIFVYGFRQMPFTYSATRTPTPMFPETRAGIRVELLPDRDSLVYSRTINGWECAFRPL